MEWRRRRRARAILIIAICPFSFLFLITSAISPFQRQRRDLSGSSTTSNYLTTQPKWMTQRVDHFTPSDHLNFQQRYYEFTEFWEHPSGPIFLRICGEGTCLGIVNDYVTVLARKFKAAIVCLEHRYYGESSPFPEFTTENLKYLTSNQALFDLATFRHYYQELLEQRHNISMSGNPWFVFGVSYSGALSAWFRLKFPHLVYGSLASSGVVQAIFNFTDFDEQIAESAGPSCSKALRDVTKIVEDGLRQNATAIKSLFGAEQLVVDGDFMYLLADAAAIAFQYGNPDVLCQPLVKASTSSKKLLGAYVRYVKEYYFDDFGSSPDTYNQENLKGTNAGPNSGDRLWWYQVCTEFAFFQVAPRNNSIRSSLVNTQYHLDLCKNVFGEGVYPEVDITNLYYGGAGISGSRIYFTNGSQDPWRHASKQLSSLGEPSILIRCHNCGHGSDLRGCPQSPFQLEGDASKCEQPNEVMRARQGLIDHMESWLYTSPSFDPNANSVA